MGAAQAPTNQNGASCAAGKLVPQRALEYCSTIDHLDHRTRYLSLPLTHFTRLAHSPYHPHTTDPGTHTLSSHTTTSRFRTRSHALVLSRDRHHYRPSSYRSWTTRRASLQPLILPVDLLLRHLGPSGVLPERPPSLTLNPPPANHVRCTLRWIIPDSLQRYYYFLLTAQLAIWPSLSWCTTTIHP
jgi:hypothetical protein